MRLLKVTHNAAATCKSESCHPSHHASLAPLGKHISSSVNCACIHILSEHLLRKDVNQGHRLLKLLRLPLRMRDFGQEICLTQANFFRCLQQLCGSLDCRVLVVWQQVRWHLKLLPEGIALILFGGGSTCSTNEADSRTCGMHWSKSSGARATNIIVILMVLRMMMLMTVTLVISGRSTPPSRQPCRHLRFSFRNPRSPNKPSSKMVRARAGSEAFHWPLENSLRLQGARAHDFSSRRFPFGGG